MANRPGDYLQGEAQTLHGVLARYEREGYGGHFGAREGGRIRCFSCSSEFPPAEASLETLYRLEGASDPADMLAVLPLTCRNCGCRGTLVVNFGPEAGLEDSEVLAALPDPLRAPEAR